MNKIDTIIDALSVAQNSVWSALNEQALAAARELQAELAKPEQAEYDKLTVKFGERAKEYLEAAKKSWQPERGCEPLYTAPPRKEWVGLTTEESSELYNKNYDLYDTDMTFMDFFMVQREVEAKLKEKNT